jgi:hypothetical protein
MSTRRTSRFLLRACRGLPQLGLVFALLISAPAWAGWNANAQWCFPAITWFGGAAPVIDGMIQGDLGWNGAYRYVYNTATNGTPQNDAVMQGVTDGKNVYLSFEVHKPVAFSDADLIMIAFDPDNNPAHQQLFEIQPVKVGETPSSSPSGVAPQVVQYWVGSLNFSGPPVQGAAVPNWVTNLNVKLQDSDGPTDYLYTLEVQIPIDPTGANGIPLPPAANFGMFLNVIRANDPVLTNVQAEWPPSANAVGLALVPPPSSEWGTGSFTGMCNGVSVVASGITDTIQPAGTTGTTLVEGDGTSNTFNVAVQNTTVSSQTGSPVLAPQIVPTFYIYNLGMPAPAQWALVPVGSNPPPQGQDIDPNTTANFSTGPWTIHNADPLYSFYQANPHQCIQVRLDAKPPSTGPNQTTPGPGQTTNSAKTCNVATPPLECSNASIVANAYVVNMNFPGSVCTGCMFRGYIGEIGTLGYDLPAGREDQIFDLNVRTQAYSTVALDQAKGLNARPNISIGTGQNLLWTVHGYRHLGKYLKIRDKTYETVSYIGGFGYGLTYEGKNPQWRYQFFGENGDQLEPLDKNNTLYRMHVKHGKVGYVNVAVEGDAAAGTGGPIGNVGGAGAIWQWWWWIILLLILLLLIALVLWRRLTHA